ncbi:hypothetical protein BDQ12DRAFT_679099 [Crucibulum laeve]|uniref:Uncharacterized protein n=1 Tax=Crucibulum laeve TaxID=68775 RepID=A0A5C3MBM7_9AGAR|nr:hypothetical protein BDQ12DRAFT_679099 [Crucibulum laeve]
MSDPRFARLKSDPRFRRPKKQQARVVVDERFKDVFEPGKKKKGKSARVDKYGRPISSTHEKDNLKRFYRLEGDEGEDEEAGPRRPDFARGEIMLESSDEEDDDSDPGEIITIGAGPSKPSLVSRDDDDAEIDLDEDNFADLEAQAAAYAKEHPEEDADVGTRTRRLAIVNLDWDHVRASHLYKICASLVSPSAPALAASSKLKDSKRPGSAANFARGKVASVCVYPSEFGKERMAREETEGPPAKIFKKGQDLDEDEINVTNIYNVGDEDDYDEDALRTYQLERLRYYYAIVTCDTVDAASHIYNELEGTELERSANVFDLSFVPEGMTFDGEPRDEATEELSANYKGVDFVTDALRHSKVKLTWDDDDPERNQVTRRTLTKKEIDEADFRAYLASSSSETEDGNAESSAPKKKKDKKASRDKLRALLLGGNDEAMPEGWGDDNDDDVDMEITFTPGLTETYKEDETTLDKYQRKMKEKRKKRKEEVKEKGSDSKGKGVDDDFFEVGSGNEEVQVDVKKGKGDRKKISKSRDEEEKTERLETTAEELALLIGSDNPNVEPQHFDLKSVLKAEKKQKGRKSKKSKSKEENNDVQEDFVIDVKDERFKVLHEDHQFAIDPSNPHFKKTKSMAALLDERQKRQKSMREEHEESTLVKAAPVAGGKSLQSLVESVKRKSANTGMTGTGKRRKL